MRGNICFDFFFSLRNHNIYILIVTRLFKLYFFIKRLQSKKKKLVLTSFYYVSWEIWLGNSKKLICIDQSGLYIFSHPRQLKTFKITSKYSSFFNNKQPASWVAHITGVFLACYSCSYYSSMLKDRNKFCTWN